MRRTGGWGSGWQLAQINLRKHRPSIVWGLSRLWMLDRYWSAPQSFTFKARFPCPGEGTPTVDMTLDP